jgi:acetyl esterase/lipase
MAMLPRLRFNSSSSERYRMKVAVVSLALLAAMGSLGAQDDSIVAVTDGQARGALPTVDKNVPYGMYSGLALLMDVYRPAAPNGFGVLQIHGAGWHSAMGYDAQPLKAGNVGNWRGALVRAGYTVFAINTRQAPQFRYPAAVEDAQRAVRFVRAHATDFAVDPVRIGVVGQSSGGHLALLLGTLDGEGVADDPDPVNRQSAKVQTVIAMAAHSDFAHLTTGQGSAVGSFLGIRIDRAYPAGSAEARILRQASPVSHATRDDAPALLLHGDKDETVPFSQSELMQSAFEQTGATVKLIRIAGGGHGFPGEATKHPEWPNITGEIIRWLDQHLKAKQ